MASKPAKNASGSFGGTQYTELTSSEGHLGLPGVAGQDLFKDEPEGWKKYISRQNAILMLYTVVLVLSRSTDYVLYVRIAKKMEKYTWFLSAVILPIAFCVISWPIAWYRMYVSKSISEEERAFPLKYFLVMAILDSVGAIAGTIPAPKLPGALQVVLSQTVIPFNMIMSYYYLKARYVKTHYIGVILIVGGVLVAMIPNFESGASSAGFVWILIFVLSNIPMAASNVYKENKLKAMDMDVWYFNAWVALFQLFFGLVTFPTVFSELLSGGSPIPPSEMGTYLTNASKCFFGINSLPGDDCEGTFEIFLFFIAFNMVFNISMLLVFKHGTATLAVVASALRVALSELEFTICFIAGPVCHDLSLYDVIALFILLAGIVFYKLRPEQSLADQLRDDDDFAFAGSSRQGRDSRLFSSMNFGQLQFDPTYETESLAHGGGTGRSGDRIRKDYFSSLGFNRRTPRSTQSADL